MRVLFVLNPKSGRRKYQKTRQQIERFCQDEKIDAQIWLWETIAEVDTILDKAIAEKFDIIFAAGGDGTINRVGRRLIGTGIPLGVLPVGTGNAFANHFYIPLNVKKALAILKKPQFITIDTAKVNDEPFICFCGFGLDAVVAHQYAYVENRSFLKYVTMSYKNYLQHKSERFIISIEGQVTEYNSIIISTNNITQFGNRAVSAPGASACDGEFDFVALSAFPRWRLPIIIYRIFAGSIDKTPYFSQVKFRSIEISRPDNLSVAQIDGEPATLGGKFKIEVVPASLKILIANDAPMEKL